MTRIRDRKLIGEANPCSFMITRTDQLSMRLKIDLGFVRVFLLSRSTSFRKMVQTCVGTLSKDGLLEITGNVQDPGTNVMQLRTGKGWTKQDKQGWKVESLWVADTVRNGI